MTLKLNKDALEQIEKNKSLSVTLKDEVVPETLDEKPEVDEPELDIKDNDKK